VRSVDSEGAGRVDTAPKSFLVAEADAVSLAEGRIEATGIARSSHEPPESPARGTLSKGFPRNLGGLLSSAGGKWW